jgi:putative ABC transport system ATP-binding protein
METSIPIVRLENLTKVYYADQVETHAISALNLSIHLGEYVSIEGPSGCGKSTLLSMIGLLDVPTSGSYELNGHSVEKLDFTERAHVRNSQMGFIFQSFNLIGDLTVYQNVEIPLIYRKVAASERKIRVQEALDRVGMMHRMRHHPAQLSGGQQQRVAAARALVGKPAVLLADEPTGNLDSANGEAVMELLADLHRGGATICLVTHDPRFARLAGRIVQMLDGKIEREARIPAEKDARLAYTDINQILVSNVL